jgi:cobaltochelatase CobN
MIYVILTNKQYKNMKKIKLLIPFLISGIIIWIIWSYFMSPTRIALVNFQPYMSTSIKLANTSSFVVYEDVSVDDIKNIHKYDFIIGFGMGLKISENQRIELNKAIEKNIPMYFYAATTPENQINTLDSIQENRIKSYLSNGNKKNYQNIALYIRKYIDKKVLFAPEPDIAVESVSDVIYHLDEEKYFVDVHSYEAYLRNIGTYHEGAPKIAIVGGMNDPFSGNRDNIDSLIVSFNKAGLNIYPIASFMKRLDFLRAIEPDAVIYFPHGRMNMVQADASIKWLKERNIPLFAPLTILQKKEVWEKDPMGMFGGFMSQSVTMPELDGAIYPYVLTAQEEDKDGLYHFKAIPNRLAEFTQIVNNYIGLKKKNNAEKKLAIYYFKGIGQEGLNAQGLETLHSLYNLLVRLKKEGYNVDNLPSDLKSFSNIINTQGSVLSTYSKGAFDDYLKKGNPALIEKKVYESWISKSMPKELYKQVTTVYGEAPGDYLSVHRENSSFLAIARVQFGNIVLLPQPMAAIGDDSFAIVHGADSPPPHTYIAAYLWSRYAFNADAMMHFGTHGSLEFTPQKQVALSNYDWPDRLVGTTPHFYYYTIGNIGESVMTKRRAYATTISYLTPPFMESNTRNQFTSLKDAIRNYYKTPSDETSKNIKKIVVKMGLHRDLRLDSTITKSYSIEDIERIENFAEEIATEKMTGELYITGIPYSKSKIHSSVLAMSADPIAYSLANIHLQRGKVTSNELKNKPFFTDNYLNPSKRLVNEILDGKTISPMMIAQMADVSVEEIEEAKAMLAPKRRMPNISNSQKNEHGDRKKNQGGHPSSIPKMGTAPKHTQITDDTTKNTKQNTQKSHQSSSKKVDSYTSATATKKEYTREDKRKAQSLVELEKTINNVILYKMALERSPELEMQAILNALSGGYIEPGPGGDAIANPNAVPTGRNLYSINAEATPSEVAWDKGVELAQQTLNQYKMRHGEYPRKVSYTFWSAEFIESEGATIAQVLYMLGVEPIRDSFGRVSDLQLIDSKSLGRPRIDVVVQTSGQFRDIAASRLALITKAVEMAAMAKDEPFDNLVAKSTIETERLLVESGLAPKTAREMSTQRVFGGINGMYGTNIQGMISSGDKWENEQEIADTYIHNMGAVYGGDKNWGQFQQGLLKAVLHNTDVIIQPRQNNTWGALSLDHVYEFMGGMNLAIRHVTGKDPEAYFSDYRNRNNYRMQELKEAIGVEARTTVFNPTYIKEVMKGSASSAAQIKEVISNMYGWNVTKPNVIDNEMWDQMYDIYVKDSYNLQTTDFMKKENPAALQEITAIMLETIRKGMWKASDEQIRELVNLHHSLVDEFGSNGAGFSGDNKKLQDFIASKLSSKNANQYKKNLQKMTTANESIQKMDNGVVLQKEELRSNQSEKLPLSLNEVVVVIVVLIVFVAVLLLMRKNRKKQL